MTSDAPVVTPRWEWRTFGASFGPAEAVFAALESTGVQESDELYVLSAGGDTVKVRAELMDVKRLIEVDADGLEQWRPVLKVGFPLARADAEAVAAALGVNGASFNRDGYGQAEFLALVTGVDPAVRPVDVHKRRVRYVIDGCTSEVTDVTVDGRPTRTIAIESTDEAAVVRAVEHVGLMDSVNTSYPKGLAAVLDGRGQRHAVIDVGTNSVKFRVADMDANGAWHTVVDRAEVTRLGEGLTDGGDIGAEPLERTATAIAGMADEARRIGSTTLSAVGTAGLRAAGNRDAVLAAIRARSGVRVEVISGDEEARLAYLAAVAGRGATGSVVVFDTGGGSSQFTFAEGGRVDDRFSLPVGAVRYTERFGLAKAVDAKTIARAREAIAADLAQVADHARPDRVIAMGGVITNMTAVSLALEAYDAERVDGTILDRGEVDRQIELYRSRDAADRRSIVGLQPGRAEVILAGACIVRTVLETLDQPSITVSDRALRHGVLADRFGATPEEHA